MNKNDFNGKLGENYSDSLIGFPHYFQIQDDFMRVILELAKKKNDELQILEAGCGSGITTARLAFLRPSCQVLAVDNSYQMITQAQKAFQSLTDRVQFLCEDVLQLNPERAFDIFASGFMMHNLIPKQRAKMIYLTYQWTKEGGIFALMDKIAQDDNTLHRQDYKQQLKYLEAFTQAGRADLYSKWVKHYQEDEEIKFTESELLKLLREVGFRNIKTHNRFCMDLIVTAQK